MEAKHNSDRAIDMRAYLATVEQDNQRRAPAGLQPVAVTPPGLVYQPIEGQPVPGPLSFQQLLAQQLNTPLLAGATDQFLAQLQSLVHQQSDGGQAQPKRARTNETTALGGGGESSSSTTTIGMGVDGAAMLIPGMLPSMLYSNMPGQGGNGPSQPSVVAQLQQQSIYHSFPQQNAVKSENHTKPKRQRASKMTRGAPSSAPSAFAHGAAGSGSPTRRFHPYPPSAETSMRVMERGISTENHGGSSSLPLSHLPPQFGLGLSFGPQSSTFSMAHEMQMEQLSHFPVNSQARSAAYSLLKDSGIQQPQPAGQLIQPNQQYFPWKPFANQSPPNIPSAPTTPARAVTPLPPSDHSSFEDGEEMKSTAADRCSRESSATLPYRYAEDNHELQAFVLAMADKATGCDTRAQAVQTDSVWSDEEAKRKEKEKNEKEKEEKYKKDMEEMEGYRSENRRLHGDATAAKLKVKDAEQKMEKLKGVLESAEEKADEGAKALIQVAILKEELESAKSKLRTTEQQLVIANSMVEEKNAQLNSKEDQLGRANKELEEKKALLDTQAANLISVQNDLQTAQTQLVSAQNSLSSIQDQHQLELNNVKAGMEEANRKLAERDDEINSVKTELNGKKDELASANGELNSVKTTLAESNHQLNARNEELESVQKSLQDTQDGQKKKDEQHLQNLEAERAARQELSVELAAIKEKMREENEEHKAILARAQEANEQLLEGFKAIARGPASTQ